MSGQFKKPLQDPAAAKPPQQPVQNILMAPSGTPPVTAQNLHLNNQGPQNFGPNNQGAPGFGPNGQGPQNFGPNNQGAPGFGPNSQVAPGFGPNGQGAPGFGPNNQGAQNFGPNGQGYVQGRYDQYGASLPGQNFSSPDASAFNRPVVGRSYAPTPDWRSSNAPSERDAKRGQKNSPRRGKRGRRVPIWARIVIGFLTFLIIVLGGGYWYYEANYAGAIASITGKTVGLSKGEVDPNAGKTGSILSRGRVNILLLGSDTDEKPQWGPTNQYLAQTDIVVSIDPATNEVDMLSFPRDYWLNVPGYGMGKLDMAFSYGGGVGANHQMSGVDVSRQVFQDDFGIPINFYAWVGLDGFVNVINTVQGVDVDVSHPIVDDDYPNDVGNTSGDIYAYQGIYIPDGPQHLDGPTALEYVRSRHADLTGDVGRSVRQQQVLDALKLKLNNPSIINELPKLASDLTGSVYTDMTTDEIFDLMRWARNVNSSKIKHLTLGSAPYATSAKVTVPGAGVEDVFYPQCNTVVPAINQFLHITTAACNISDAGGGSQLASTQGQQIPLLDTTQPVMASTVSSPLVAGGSAGTNPLDMYNNLFGVRDIIDLMSMVLLNSPQA